MINLEKMEQYRENNRLEVKKATGGLPKSVWETYSSFANTLGGVILLGVEENDDRSLSVVGLDNPEKLVKEFWDIINNQNKVSINILIDNNVRVETIDDKRIIVIEVPRAIRFDRPIYIDNNLLGGVYRRNGEGDYKCTKEAVQSMLRDASAQSLDARVLEKRDLEVFDLDSVRRYRMCLRNIRGGHVWEKLGDMEFLHKLGAVDRGEDGKLHPTVAGLLMFGYEYEILHEFSYYFLDYQEQYDLNNRWTDRIISSSGEWSGNLYDFFFRVYNKIAQDIKTPFKLQNGFRVDDTPIHSALREALANCLINADYYGRRGLVVIKRINEITMANPGAFRIELEAAKDGGVSDPRNAVIMKMFNLIEIGERAGSGISKIYAAWEEQGLETPVIEEMFEPERTTVRLSLVNKKVAIKSGDKKVAIKNGDNKDSLKTQKHKDLIIDYLNKEEEIKCSDIESLLSLQKSRARELLGDMVKEDILVAVGGNRNRTYRLKNK